MKKAISYARRSRDENTDAIKKQHSENRRYANTHGLTIHAEYDETVSGYESMDQHKKLNIVLNKCAEEGIKDILVTNISRLTRSVRDGVLLLDWLHRNGIILHFSTKEKVYTAVGHLDVIKELIAAEEYYWKFIQAKPALPVNGFYSKGRPPNGYTARKKNRGILAKSGDSTHVTDVFEQAISLRKRSPALPLPQIVRRIETIKYKKHAITRMLSNPLYTGRKAPHGTLNIAELRRYGKKHEAYISDEDFILLNGGKVVRHLAYSKFVVCKKCSPNNGNKRDEHHLVLDGENLRCKKCERSVRIRKLENAMEEMCRNYYFDPDQSAEYKFEHISVISQLESIFQNITDQGSNRKILKVFVPSDPNDPDIQKEIWKDWEALKTQMRKRLYMGADDIALHYVCAQMSPSKESEIAKLLERCFGGVYVEFGGRGSITLTPMEGKDYVKNNPFIPDNAQYVADKKALEVNIDERMKFLRDALKANPFLSDYLAWNTIDRCFMQWKSFQDYADKHLLYDPYL
ncbi:MAG: recombinase family protein [Candidatus Cloacimonetes bacterium]|nr:recombinase family protein [Candidatus Cloacimonadota bacterium]